MSRLVWGDPVKSIYETGIDRGVFYPQGGVGVPWNGLIAVNEAPSGSDIRKAHYDGQMFRQERTSESFSASIQAYSYPKKFEEYDGYSDGLTGQVRKMFGLSYRTLAGYNLDGSESYLLHLVYNCVVSPSTRNSSSFSDGINPAVFEWSLNTVPEILPTGEFSAHVVINPKIAYPWAMSAIEDILYGTGISDSRFPGIIEVVNLFENASILRITDNGDGSWTAEGPDEAISMLDSTSFEITWPSAIYLDSETYRISSL